MYVTLGGGQSESNVMANLADTLDVLRMSAILRLHAVNDRGHLPRETGRTAAMARRSLKATELIFCVDIDTVNPSWHDVTRMLTGEALTDDTGLAWKYHLSAMVTSAV
jgi:hypothetical protein